MKWHVSFNNAGNPENMALGEFLADMLNKDEEAAMRVYGRSSFEIRRVKHGQGETVLFCVLGPTHDIDVAIEKGSE
jgi:hypothetical protein